jgi:hypothetical protein
MSTKKDAGPFDCYAKLFDDEPYFVLRAKDPDAPALVEEWATRRLAQGQGGNPKIPEALQCASAMRAWRSKVMHAQACGCDPGVKHHCELWPNCAFGIERQGRL